VSGSPFTFGLWNNLEASGDVWWSRLDASHALPNAAGRRTPVDLQLSPFNGVTLYQLIAPPAVPVVIVIIFSVVVIV